MVFFNCNACGEALKKNQVEKHYLFQCKNCTVLSCVDCQKDFPGDTYKEHTKCITEDEKYSGKGWKPKANMNKGEQKQEAWTQQVVTAIEKCRANHKLKAVLVRIKDYPNIPRKKAKFENFLTNSMRVHDFQLITQAWDEINVEINQAKSEEVSDKMTVEEPAAGNGSDQPDEPERTEKLSKRERKEERRKKQHKMEKKHKGDGDCDRKMKKKAKKRKLEEIEEEGKENGTEDTEGTVKSKKHKTKGEEEDPEDEADAVKLEKFRWDTVVLALLEKAPDNEMTLKKLRKKVLCEFHARGGDGNTFTEEKLMSKFNKKVLKNPRFKIHKERIKLSH